MHLFSTSAQTVHFSSRVGTGMPLVHMGTFCSPIHHPLNKKSKVGRTFAAYFRYILELLLVSIMSLKDVKGTGHMFSFRDGDWEKGKGLN